MRNSKPISANGTFAGLAVAAAGLLLLFLALRMDRDWTYRHFLPAWSYAWQSQLRIVAALRAMLGLLGLILMLLAAPLAARAVSAGRGRQLLGITLACLLAGVAALGTTELVLRTRTWRSIQDRADRQEPLRRRDGRLGWTFVPDHQGFATVAGRRVRYATDRYGYRRPRPGLATDLERPTVILGGESIMFGYGLDWPETIGARLEALTGLSTATIAVNAYGTDQALMRLRQELPRFARPVAVVIPFMPRLLDRNLEQDRPHLDARLRWSAGAGPSWRIVELARRGIRYRSTTAVPEGETMTRAALRQAAALAVARGARPVILVPIFLPESDAERAIRLRLLDRGGIAYLKVPLGPQCRNLPDSHPNPRGAAAIAEAVAARLGHPNPGAELEACSLPAS